MTEQGENTARPGGSKIGIQRAFGLGMVKRQAHVYCITLFAAS